VSAVLIISIFLLSALSFAIYRTKRRSSKGAAEQESFPAPPRGLFDEPLAPRRAAVLPDAASETVSAELAARLRERAAAGDLSTLEEAAEARDAALYDAVLDSLLWREATAENVAAVASHVVNNKSLRANGRLARALLSAWESSPQAVKLTDLLRVAALSDDARVFQDTFEAVAEAWERGRLTERTPDDLAQLFESEYWVLSAEARRSGAGFLLKQRLADVRRHLAARSRQRTLSTGQGQN
jgi:hypothetical protein